MLKHFCDRCDKPFPTSQLAVIRGTINAGQRPSARIGTYNVTTDDCFAELCPACLTELQDWLHIGEASR